MSDDKYRLNTSPYGWLHGRAGILLRQDTGANATATDTGSKTLRYDGDVPVEADYRSGALFIDSLSKNEKTPARFLPWKPDHCTYMQIDDNVDIVWTAQLTGCNIYVYTSTGVNAGTWLFHSNSNANSSNLNSNNAEKRTMASTARNFVGGGSGFWDRSLERGVQSFYPEGAAAGIFFGQRRGAVDGSGDSWKWYLYDPLSGLVYGV